MKMTSSSASLSLTRLLLLLLSSAVVAAFDSTEIRMLDDDYLSSKRSAPLIRFGRRVTLDEHSGYPMMHLNKRATLSSDYDGGDIDEEALARTIRAQVGAPLIRFGKRAAASAPLIRFGRAPAAAAPLIRFGKRSAPTAPFVRFGRANIAAPAAPLIRFGKRSASDAEESDNEE